MCYNAFEKLIFVFLFLHCSNSTLLFPNSAQIYHIPNAYFGFSVQLQSGKDGPSWVLVGAPIGNSSFPKHRGIVEPGVVYSCPLNSNECTEFVFDEEGNTNGIYNNFNYTDHKDKAWLGAAVDSSSTTDGNILSCAPRWINDWNTGDTEKLIGLCYYYDNVNQKAKKLIPLIDYSKMFTKNSFQYILGQAGFSAHLLENASSAILSSPGMYNWTGSLIQYNNLNQEQSTFHIINPIRDDMKVETYAYFGYAITSGKFNKDGKLYYAAGAPRNNKLTGSIFLFETLTATDKPFVNRYILNGGQVGEYFGAALAVADINGDGMDDIVVGAPMYSKNSLAIQEDVGRIYVYLAEQKPNKVLAFTKSVIIIGEQENARFGNAISSLGDINKDGFMDIAVGAPYFENKGAVFIYLGTKTGISLTPSQRILASDFNTNLVGFGYSLSKGIDIDNNHYNDLAVGAYLSGHVVVLKSRPRATINMLLVSDINTITVDTKTFSLKSCLDYTGKYVPESLDINITVTAQPALITLSPKSKRNSYKLGENYCETITADVTQTLMENQIVHVEMSYELDEGSPGTFCKTCPVVDVKVPKSVHVNIPFSSGCKEVICHPDLKLSSRFSGDNQKLVLGSEKAVSMEIIVENKGENAFQTELFVQKPQILTLEQLPPMCKETEKRIECTVGNPLKQNEKKIIPLSFTGSELTTDNTVALNISVNSSGHEVSQADNTINVALPLVTDVSFEITGSSIPKQISINNTEIESITHIYDIENKGISNLNELELTIWIPERTLNEEIIGCTKISEETGKDNSIERVTDDSPLDRTYFFNCSSPSITCKKISCQINDKVGSKEISITYRVNTTVLDELRENKDLVIVTTSVKIDSKYASLTEGYVWTTLKYQPQVASLTKWIVIGILCGILAVLLLVLILYKIKFFDRKKIVPEEPENADADLLNTENDELNNDEVKSLSLHTLKKLNENEDDDSESQLDPI